ncbi:MAG: TrmH family RNA methyltransferase [Anaerovoracaceae bacterium]|jgi:TrmH family RNA methyltransferase
MKTITSVDNQLYKSLFRLKQKKHRDRERKYLIEGPNLITEAIESGEQLDFILCSSHYSFQEEAVPIIYLDEKLFLKLSDTESPQGVMAVARKKIYSEEEFFSQDKVQKSNIVVLDRLQDPGNIGTILRTAEAAGYKGAMIIKGTADIYAPKIVRAATGTLFRLPTFFVETAEEAIDLLKRYHKKTVCTVLSDSQKYYEVDLKEDTALIIGNEGNGASKEFIINSDIRVKIPMGGSVESLNAAVAAGILMYESFRQRQNQ